MLLQINQNRVLLYLIIGINSLLINTACFAQHADTIWYNNKWAKTDIVAEHYYYSVVIFDSIQNIFKVTDFYPDGKMQMEGEYSSINPKVKNGEFTWYNKDQNIILYNYYRNDSLMIKGIYDESGKRKYTVYEREYIQTLNMTEKEKLGLKNQIDEPASFPGGEEMLHDFLLKNVIYPESASRQKIEELVFTTFTVTTKGKIKNIKIPAFTNPAFVVEVKRVINLMPNWIPGKDKGELVESTVTIPIRFVVEK